MLRALAPKAVDKSTQLFESADTEEALMDKLCLGGLQVVEVYSAWAGYCTAVHPLIRKLKTDFVGKPVNFIWAKSDNNPMLKSYGGKSQPHFLLYRNGNLMETVVGANVPLLAKLIPKLCPETLAEDKPEDNPMIKKRKEDLEAAAKKPDSAGKDSAT